MLEAFIMFERSEYAKGFQPVRPLIAQFGRLATRHQVCHVDSDRAEPQVVPHRHREFVKPKGTLVEWSRLPRWM
jgi:hypothetical protein